MLLLLPVRVRQVVGVGKVEPINTATPVLPDSVLSATEPIRFVYCSISRPGAALEDRFSQLLIVLPETFNIREAIPVGA